MRTSKTKDLAIIKKYAIKKIPLIAKIFNILSIEAIRLIIHLILYY